MIEGSGAGSGAGYGSVRLINGLDPDPGCPKTYGSDGSGTRLPDVALRKTETGRTYVRNDDGGCEDGQLRIMLQREHD